MLLAQFQGDGGQACHVLCDFGGWLGTNYIIAEFQSGSGWKFLNLSLTCLLNGLKNIDFYQFNF